MTMYIEVDGNTVQVSPEQEAAILADQQQQQQVQAARDTDYQLKRTQIRNFYDACKSGTATLGQMRTAWVQLIEYLYAKEIAN